MDCLDMPNSVMLSEKPPHHMGIKTLQMMLSSTVL